MVHFFHQIGRQRDEQIGGILGIGIVLFSLFSSDLLASRPLSLAPQVKKVENGIVDIYVTHVVAESEAVFNPFQVDPFFKSFFDDFLAPFSRGQRVSQGSGSGVVVSEKGLVVTCAHVIQNAKKIRILFKDGRSFNAKVVKSEDAYDLALLQLDLPQGVSVPCVQLGDSESLYSGDGVFAIGNSFGIGQSVSSGIISAIDRVLNKMLVLQTDTSLNPGNSGGGLFNLDGELVGIPNAILSKSGGSQGVAFALRSSLVRCIVEEAQGLKKRAHFGFGVRDLKADETIEGALENLQGLIVTKRYEDCAVDELQEGDIITHIDDKPISQVYHFNFLERVSYVGKERKMKGYRKGKPFSFRLIPKEHIFVQIQPILLKENHMLKGFYLLSMTPYLKEQLNIPSNIQGVFVYGVPSQSIYGVNLQKGDVILKVNGGIVTRAEDVEVVLLQKKNFVELSILRQGSVIEMNLRIG